MSNYNIPIESKIYPKDPRKVGEFIDDLKEMKNKYYTPKIEEFHVGFEYEYGGPELWMTCEIIENDYIEPNVTGFVDLLTDVKSGKCRVKYLDQSDIESFGFIKAKDEFYQSETGILVGGNNDPNYYYITNKIDRGDSGFSGIIKNKSELKQILKMIGVIEDE